MALLRSRRPRLPKLYFLHVPKTAGTSLARVLLDAYRKERERAIGPALLQDLLREENRDWRDARLLFGHFARLPLEEAAGFEVATVLREPGQHLLSVHGHIRRSPAHDLHQIVASEDLSFLDWLRDPRMRVATDNLQARQLALVPDARPLRPGESGSIQDRFQNTERTVDDARLLADASRTLESCAVAGTVERIDDFSDRLATYVGRRLRSMPRLNTGETHRELTAAERRVVEERAPVDLELYERCRRLTT